MNRYETSTPRAALGLTAVAMAAVTMVTMVVLPAQFGSVSAQSYTLAVERAQQKWLSMSQRLRRASRRRSRLTVKRT